MASNNEDETLLTDLFKCVSFEALKGENLKKYDIKIYATDDKIEQYGSDVALIDIFAENVDSEKREYSLVLKYGHTQKNVRNKVPIRARFIREIQVYSKLIPCYQRFQRERRLPVFSAAPKCFLTKLSPTTEIIVLENLRKRGYRLHDRKTAMSVAQIELVLEIYAQWHALSFALDHHKDAEYSEIKRNFVANPWREYFDTQLGELIDFGQETLYNILKCNDKKSLLKKYKRKIGKATARTVLDDLMERKERSVAILHGDCWNNNFLFMHQNDDTAAKPHCTGEAEAEEAEADAAAKLLDFQMACLRSPVFDLSHFIYSVASEEELRYFRQMLDHYYAHFAAHLKRLECDPAKIFPFKMLKSHWRKYAAYGAVLNPFITMYSFIDKENTADFGVCQTLKNTTTKLEYMERVVAVAKHFVEFKF